MLYGPQGKPIAVNAHDLVSKELGKVVPYGVYDVGANLGYVSLGSDHDTGQFAVNGIRLWLDRMGKERYPTAPSLMITADGGGSNGSRPGCGRSRSNSLPAARHCWRRQLQ